MATEDRIILDSTIGKKTATSITRLLDRYFKDSGFDTSYISYEFSNNGVIEITPSDKWVDEWEWVSPYALDTSENGEELETEEEMNSAEEKLDEADSKRPERRDDFDTRKRESAAVIDTFIERLTELQNSDYYGNYRTLRADSWELMKEGLKTALKGLKTSEKVDMRAVINDPTYTPPKPELVTMYAERPTPAFKKVRDKSETVELVEPPRTNGRPIEVQTPKLPHIDIAAAKRSLANIIGKRTPQLTPKALAVISATPTFRQKNLAAVSNMLGLGNGTAPNPESDHSLNNGADTYLGIALAKEQPQSAAAINDSGNLHKRITVGKGVMLSEDQVGVIAATIDKYFADRNIPVSGINYNFGIIEQLGQKFIMIGNSVLPYAPGRENTPFQTVRRDLLTENGERILRENLSTTGTSILAPTWKELLTGLNERLEKAGKQVLGR